MRGREPNLCGKKILISEEGEQVSILLNFNCVCMEEFKEEGDLD